MEVITLNETLRDDIREYVNRIEQLDVEKAEISTLQRELFAELKAKGYNAKAVRQIIALRKQDAHDRETLLWEKYAYMKALGMLPAFLDE